jgi:hypothetical protein
MERAHPQFVSTRFTNELCYSVAHLASSLIRKRQGENLPRLDVLLEKVGNSAGQHSCLSGPCSRHDEGWTFGCRHGIPLNIVEAFKG